MIKRLVSLSLRQKTYVFLISIVVISLVIMVFSQESMTGPFGLGLPAKTRVFLANREGFSIQYPQSWAAFETPQGSHGDEEVIAVILVPGRSFPQVYIARHFSPVSDISQVIAWGEIRARTRNGYLAVSVTNFNTPYLQGIMREYLWYDITLFGQLEIRCKDWYSLKGNGGYDLSFCAESKDWQQFDAVLGEMVKSFMIIAGK
jgi:hypothetical protein